ncbi:unnamed protein product [Pleuronectes platessa]|uniref:Uncharacterized protein n=1 Tax=Pleuronectes platessa TaxID=8262 RepID=A0A9N7TWE7_PLEPL|nr:unnamed protein product [Pleuronectes platessa]
MRYPRPVKTVDIPPTCGRCHRAPRPHLRSTVPLEVNKRESMQATEADGCENTSAPPRAKHQIRRLLGKPRHVLRVAPARGEDVTRQEPRESREKKKVSEESHS